MVGAVVARPHQDLEHGGHLAAVTFGQHRQLVGDRCDDHATKVEHHGFYGHDLTQVAGGSPAAWFGSGLVATPLR